MAKNEEMKLLMNEYMARNSSCVNVKRNPELANVSDEEIIARFENLRNH